MQIKLLKILACLGAADKTSSDNMYAVLGDTLRKANTGHTISNAIVAECVRTITAIYPNPGLLQAGESHAVSYWQLRPLSHCMPHHGTIPWYNSFACEALPERPMKGSQDAVVLTLGIPVLRKRIMSVQHGRPTQGLVLVSLHARVQSLNNNGVMP